MRRRGSLHAAPTAPAIRITFPAAPPAATGTPASTNDACDGSGGCIGGSAPNCNDNNPCTDDSCAPTSGCVYTNNSNPCDDGNACTTGDTCGGGACNPGGPTNCDDGQCCTIDHCNPSTGCYYTANTTPPVIVNQPTLGCAVLWPPQHGYVDFGVASTGVTATSQCGIASLAFASCASSQPENAHGTGDGNSTEDCVYTPSTLSLRAERDGACSPVGRVYTSSVVATDVCGNSTTSNGFDVGVWHDRGHPRTARTTAPIPDRTRTTHAPARSTRVRTVPDAARAARA